MTSNTRKSLIAAVVTAGLCASTIAFAAPAYADDNLSDEQLQGYCASNPSSCTFMKESESEPWIEWHRAGDPVTNCGYGSAPISYLVGDVRTWSESWTVSGGLELKEVLGIEIGGEYTRMKSVTKEQRTNILANPGRKNAVTIGAQKKHEYGRIDVVVDSSYWIPDAWQWVEQKQTYTIGNVDHIVPTGYTEVGQDERPCSMHFNVDPEDGGPSGVPAAFGDIWAEMDSWTP